MGEGGGGAVAKEGLEVEGAAAGGRGSGRGGRALDFRIIGCRGFQLPSAI